MCLKKAKNVPTTYKKGNNGGSMEVARNLAKLNIHIPFLRLFALFEKRDQTSDKNKYNNSYIEGAICPSENRQ